MSYSKVSFLSTLDISVEQESFLLKGVHFINSIFSIASHIFNIRITYLLGLEE